LKKNIEKIITFPKSSFYWGMRILKKEKRNAMFVVYAFCKKVDTIADSNLPNKKKIKNLNKLKSEINEIFNNKPKNNFGIILNENIKKFKLKKKYFFDVIKGVEMDIKNIMICPSKKNFNLYCYRVAGAVGLISLGIFGEYNKNGKSFALYLAKALQITNILRDIKEDEEMGRIYIPKEILNKYNIKKEKISLMIQNKMFPKACWYLSKIADHNFKMAKKKLKYCSENKLKSAVLMMETYKILLNKLKKNKWENLEKKIYLTNFEKIYLFVKGIIF
tara:strand:- start:13010 stop:13837 length:828 start_codon:yes stop_codon:yes gene_type:complete